MKISQTQRVLNHLIDHGYITQTIANNYGIRRLAARINDLKGWCNIEVQTRYDDAGVRYAYYTMSDLRRDYERQWRSHGYNYALRPCAA